MLQIPFVPSPKDGFCAQAASTSVLLGYNARTIPTAESMYAMSPHEVSNNTYTVDTVNTLQALGLRVEYCNLARPEDIAATPTPPETLMRRYEALQKSGVLRQLALTPDDFRCILDRGMSIISLIDFRQFWKIEGIHNVGSSIVGHYVSVIGHEGDNFTIHQSGTHKPKAGLQLSTEKLFGAVRAAGTYLDTIVVHGLR